MSKKLESLIFKLRYLNSLIINISKTNEEILHKERDIETSLNAMEEKLENQIARQEEIKAQLKHSIIKAEALLETSNKNADYVNLEYLYLLQNIKKKILLVGFYGARNLGDELMLQKVYADLEVDKNNIYVLMCDNKELDVFRYEGMNILHYPKTKFDYNFLANQFECVVFGGGAIIDDSQYKKENSYTFDMGRIYAELSLAFIQKNKRVYSLGLSTSRELTDAEYIKKISKIIRESSYFSVRDRYSARLLEKVSGEKINQINDIVLTYEKPLVLRRSDQKFVIGIIWICYDNMKQQLQYLIKQLLCLEKNEELEIKCIPFYDYRDCDRLFYASIKEYFNNDDRITITDMPWNFRDAYIELSNCDLILSMRYHGAVIGLMAGVETCSLLYAEHEHYYNKMADIYEKFDQKEKLFLSVEEIVEYISIQNAEDAKEKKRKRFDNSEYEKAVKKIGESI